MILLDGATGTELLARGVSLGEGPEDGGTEALEPGATVAPWSALAVARAPEAVLEVHRAYARAGADLLTACSFRTRPKSAPSVWAALAARAVALARQASLEVRPDGSIRVAGSLGPSDDCYRPERSPGASPEARAEHRAVAEALACAGADLLLCETFACPAEARVAVAEAARTGLPTFAALTAGPHADLLSPRALEEAARACAGEGARVLLVNCTPAEDTRRFLERLARVGLPFGAYANAGPQGGGLGWDAPESRAAEAYAALAETWAEAGATFLGGCCGTRPAHVRALRARFPAGSTPPTSILGAPRPPVA